MRTCNVVGFELTVGPKVSFHAIKSVGKLTATIVRSKNPKVAITTETDASGIIYGKIVTFTNEKSVPVGNGTTFVLSSMVAPKDFTLTIVNYFIFNPVSKSGVFLANRGGVGLSAFGEYIRRIIANAIKSLKDQEVKKAGGRKAPNAEKTKIDEEFFASVRPLFRTGEMEKIIEEWQSLDVFQYTTRKPSEGKDCPLDEKVDREVRNLHVVSKLSSEPGKAYDWFLRTKEWAIKKFGVSAKPKMKGTDQHGKSSTKSFDDFVDVLDVIPATDVESDSISCGDKLLESTVLIKMKQTMCGHPVIFKLPVKEK